MAEKTINSKFYKTKSQPALGFGETWVKLVYDPTNGDTRLLQYNISVVGSIGNADEIYKNGVWNYIPGAVTSVSEKQKVHKLVKDLINKSLKGVPGNVINAFVSQDAPSRDEGTSGNPVPSESSGGLLENIGEVLGPINIEDNFDSSNMSKLFPVGKNLKYPNDILETKQDTLQITQYEYQAPYRDVFSGKQNTKDLFKLGAQRQSALKKPLSTVILPIPNNVSDTNQVNWGDGDQTNAMSMAATGNVKNIAGIVGLSQLAGAIAPILGQQELGKILGSDQAANAAALFQMGALSNPTTQAAIHSLILKKAGFDISPETILSRGYGVVANSNLELLFSGPMLRGFQFGYVLSPRSEKEAATCRNIIRFFKQGMAAKKSNSAGGYGASSFLLSTPNVFKLQYKTNGNKDIKGLNKFKICALTNIQTSYADGQWAAFEEGQPVRYQINLTFKELEPIYESDYQDKESDKFISDYKDQPGVKDDEIGF
jgi:hypothetical protein